MRESGLSLVLVILDYRPQRFAARLANACCSKLKELHHISSCSALIWTIIREEHEDGWATESTDWLPPDEQSVVRTTILDNTTAAKSTAQCLAREKEAKIWEQVGMWWTDETRPDHAQG